MAPSGKLAEINCNEIVAAAICQLHDSDQGSLWAYFIASRTILRWRLWKVQLWELELAKV